MSARSTLTHRVTVDPQPSGKSHLIIAIVFGGIRSGFKARFVAATVLLESLFFISLGGDKKP